MIAQIKGRLVEKTPTYVIIDCGGVGYQLNISLHTYSNLGDDEDCKLFTHLVVREDAHLLYGFGDKPEREIFLMLISVSGVGAASAMMIISSLSPAEVQQAILEGDVNRLKSVKGIGNKTAQRIIIDLKDKLGKADLELEFSGMQRNTLKDEALSALVMLGFAKNVAEKEINKILKAEGEATSVEALIKSVLKGL